MIAHYKMQKWSKFQFQSRILKKIIFLLLFVVLVSIPPMTYAQEDLGLLIEQQTIIFEVGRHSSVHVKHVIETGKWNEDRPRIIEILPGVHSNLRVADEDGDRLGHSFDGETFEKSEYIILKQKLGNYDLIAEYDIENFMELENGKWTRDLQYNFDVLVMLEDDIELIFVNSRPVDTIDSKGINCIGCNLVLEYFDTNVTSISNEIFYQDEEFVIEILSNDEVSELEFIGGGTQMLNFKTENLDQLFVLKIPLELIPNPFDVYFTEKDDTSLEQLDKIRKTEFDQDKQNVKVSFRTSGEGIISIVGATPEEHEKRIQQEEKREQSKIENERIDEKKGFEVPIPGKEPILNESEFEKNQVMKEESTLSFGDELTSESVSISNSDNSIIFIIIGIIAAIIVGVIVKVKKN